MELGPRLGRGDRDEGEVGFLVGEGLGEVVEVGRCVLVGQEGAGREFLVRCVEA